MLEVGVEEAVDAAQQIFEGAAEDWLGTEDERKVYVKAVLFRWPWLRPNPYQPRRTTRTKA